MEWKMITLKETTVRDKIKGFYRAKKAYFEVNGSEHTLVISMPDFNAGKTNELVQKEVDLILGALNKTVKK